MKNGTLLTAYQVSFNNDAGGTSIAVGCFKFKVTKSFHDYETGNIIHGELVDEEKIKELKKIGTTGLENAQKNYEPKVVYVNASYLLKKNISKTKSRKVKTLNWFDLSHDQQFGNPKKFLYYLLQPVMDFKLGGYKWNK